MFWLPRKFVKFNQNESKISLNMQIKHLSNNLDFSICPYMVINTMLTQLHLFYVISCSLITINSLKGHIWNNSIKSWSLWNYPSRIWHTRFKLPYLARNIIRIWDKLSCFSLTISLIDTFVLEVSDSANFYVNYIVRKKSSTLVSFVIRHDITLRQLYNPKTDVTDRSLLKRY